MEEHFQKDLRGVTWFVQHVEETSVGDKGSYVMSFDAFWSADIESKHQ
jgi:hypothetical protein